MSPTVLMNANWLEQLRSKSMRRQKATKEDLNYNLLGACKKLDFAGIKNALARGASVKAVDFHGNTALTFLCNKGFRTAESATVSREIALQLLAQGADVKAVGSNGHTALTLLCGNGFTTGESAAASSDMVLRLLAQGADAKAVDSNGNTALAFLCQDGFSTAESATVSR
jgi:ankyrin repeat protein